jgi:hypothetical protein
MNLAMVDAVIALSRAFSLRSTKNFLVEPNSLCRYMTIPTTSGTERMNMIHFTGVLTLLLGSGAQIPRSPPTKPVAAMYLYTVCRMPNFSLSLFMSREIPSTETKQKITANAITQIGTADELSSWNFATTASVLLLPSVTAFKILAQFRIIAIKLITMKEKVRSSPNRLISSGNLRHLGKAWINAATKKTIETLENKNPR